MRDILFRGKRKDNGRWAYGYVDATMYKHIVVINTDDGGAQFEVQPDTVGEYTGCDDDFNKPIYEGDIVTFAFLGKSKLTIRFRDGSFFAQDDGCGQIIYLAEIFRLKNLLPLDEKVKKLKVVGNIHDNPEMLEGGDHAKTND